ncbi:MAG: hypothetical protein DCF25_03365 [Leptolyngbya foveolarum]|uniref:Prevent-host-death protein n=1 Tax=Leptolyngbya foveolarum TaxID=47253 RepID=A0A2W4USK0_9CYAN|nr:MAG: hypothetical protein DCF25_03365 [Leptolyngbya foveolarum]
MSGQAIEYIRDTAGEPSAVVIPIAIWRQIFPDVDISVEQLTEQIEDYCLNKAMDEAAESPLMSREEAIAFLQEDEG